MNNGKTAWILWLAGILATIFISSLSVLAANVVANDRMRASEDQRIESTVVLHSAQLAELVECSRNIKLDLAEIKSILKRTSPYERK